MTPLQLLDALEAFVKQETKDILLPVRVDRKSGENKERAAEVYKSAPAEQNRANGAGPLPACCSTSKRTDTQEQGQDPESECIVRIVAATYSEDESEGAMCVLNLLTRIRVALLKDGVVGGQFVLESPLEMIVYPDSTAPYYLGEMMTKWTMPIIESEVQQIWQ